MSDKANALIILQGAIPAVLKCFPKTAGGVGGLGGRGGKII